MNDSENMQPTETLELDEWERALSRYLSSRLENQIGRAESAFLASAAERKRPRRMRIGIAASAIAAALTLAIGPSTSNANRPTVHILPTVASNVIAAASPSDSVAQSPAFVKVLYSRITRDDIVNLAGVPTRVVQRDWVEANEYIDPAGDSTIEMGTPAQQTIFIPIDTF